MPAGAQERALAKRGAWIDRHLDNIAQTFSKLVVTSADITMLQHAIEADQTLVHAAYYTDDECVARIADWIAAKDDVPSNAIIAAEARGEA
jgi:rRNA maturation endonuclease Nob1